MDREGSEGGAEVASGGHVADCVFCGIADRGAPDELIAEGENWLAFFPLNPATPGHTLVIPRAHIPDFWQAPPLVAAELAKVCVGLGKAIRLAVSAEGMNLITSQGSVAEQTVFHLHLHLVPRWTNDGFGEIWPPAEPLDKIVQAQVASRVQAAYRAEIGRH